MIIFWSRRISVDLGRVSKFIE